MVEEDVDPSRMGGVGGAVFENVGRRGSSNESRDAVGLRVSRAASRSVIAFDVDRTVLHQDLAEELNLFREGVGQSLIRLARLGFNLAAITGNSLSQLSCRFLTVLIEELCATREIQLLTSFHFFCNGAALYVHVDHSICKDFGCLVARQFDVTLDVLVVEAKKCFFNERGLVRSRYIPSRYIMNCSISSEDAKEIMSICVAEVSRWWSSVCGADGLISESLRARFYIASGTNTAADEETKRETLIDEVNSEAAVFGPLHLGAAPKATLRTCVARDGQTYVTSCNVMPVISFRHARRVVLKAKEDPRMCVIERIKSQMRHRGLVRYIVQPGGRATIDISHHLVNKRSALIWLLRRLGAEGVEQMGEPLGANAIYFGDEVVLNGNDLVVADVPGVLVFAVNELAHRVPFKNNVELPTEFTLETGPEATKAVLDSFIGYVEEALRKEAELWDGKSAVAAWKEMRLRRRLEKKSAALMGLSALGPFEKLTYRRLEAAAACLTALTRQGEGLDDLADTVIDLVNNIGMLGATVRDHQFQSVHAQGFCNRAVRDTDFCEDSLIEELELGRLDAPESSGTSR